MMKKMLAIVLGFTMMVGLAVATGQPAQAEPENLASCSFPMASWMHINNTFGCLGDYYALADPDPMDGNNGCVEMQFLTSPSFPPPNGWSNQMSSGVNSSNYAIGFFDAFSCAGPVLFAINAHTKRDSLVSAANNKASSFRIVSRAIW